jgi:glycosyltransferase involved in cell wall biosynthesis
MNRPINVCHLLPTAGVGGAEKFVLSLCRSHDPMRIKVVVGVLLSDDIVSRKIASEGFECVIFGMKNGFDVFRALKLTLFLRKRKIDIVNIHGQNPLGIFCSILACPPVIVNTDHGTTLGSQVKRKNRVVFTNRFLLPFVDHSIAISKGMEKSLLIREKIDKKKITLVYNGIDVDAIKNTLIDIRKLKITLKIPPTLPVIGTVGRLAPEKQYPVLLECLAFLKNQGRIFIALIIGEGPLRPLLEAQIDQMGLRDCVRLLGLRSDVYQLMKLIDIFTLASGGEAFSITLLEAMASAKPVVAFDVEGINEAVVNEATGFLIPPGDTVGFSKKLADLIDSPELRTQMGQYGFQRVEKKFNITEKMKDLEAIYDKLLQNKATDCR